MLRHRTLVAERKIQSSLKPRKCLLEILIFECFNIVLSLVCSLVGGLESAKIAIKRDFWRERHNYRVCSDCGQISNSAPFGHPRTAGGFWGNALVSIA